MTPEIEKFKDQLIDTMITAFEKDGHFTLSAFILTQKDNLIVLVPPIDTMESSVKKDSFVNLIKKLCKDPNTKAAAIIMEVNIKNSYGIKIGDGLWLVISTKDGDDVTIYNVDCDHKKVIGLFNIDLPGSKFKGRFTNFFQNDNN